MAIILAVMLVMPLRSSVTKTSVCGAVQSCQKDAPGCLDLKAPTIKHLPLPAPYSAARFTFPQRTPLVQHCMVCSSYQSSYEIWYPSNATLTFEAPVYIFAPATGQSPMDYSSTLAAVAANGIIVVATYINWDACFSGMCSSPWGDTNCYEAWLDAMKKGIEFAVQGLANALTSLEGINVQPDTKRLVVGGHSGGAWPALAAATQASPSIQSRIRGVLLQHPSESPYQEGVSMPVEQHIQWDALSAKTWNLKLLTVCGTLCQLTCDQCLFDALGGLRGCPAPYSDCSDCMTFAGCKVAEAYAKKFASYAPKKQITFVRGPWWHVAAENKDAAFDGGPSGCGAEHLWTAETEYVVWWLTYVLNGDEGSLLNILKRNGTPSSFSVARCGISINGPVEVTSM